MGRIGKRVEFKLLIKNMIILHQINFLNNSLSTEAIKIPSEKKKKLIHRSGFKILNFKLCLAYPKQDDPLQSTALRLDVSGEKQV